MPVLPHIVHLVRMAALEQELDKAAKLEQELQMEAAQQELEMAAQQEMLAMAENELSGELAKDEDAKRRRYGGGGRVNKCTIGAES